MTRSPSRTKISILHLAESAGWAGGETYLLALARRLDRSRFRLIVLLPEAGPLQDRLQAEDVETHHWAMGRLGQVGPLLHLRERLRQQPVDILQAHGARTNFYSRVVGRWTGAPVIISTVHNSLFDYPVGGFKKALYVGLDWASAPLAHRILCVAESHRRELLRRYRLAPTAVITIPNGVDLERFHPGRYGRQVRREWGIPENTPLLGVIGRLTRQKGHIWVLRALQRLTLQFPTLRCLIVGDGELRAELQRQAADLLVAENCVFAGVREDIPAILSALDVLVIPSLSEGLPYVALEGMAMARPVVATAVNGLQDLIQDRVTGRLVPKENSQRLAEVIAELLSNRVGAVSLGYAGRRQVEQEYSIQRWIERLEALYLQLHTELVLGKLTPAGSPL